MWRAGRGLGEGSNTALRITLGTISEFEGMVQETTRSFYDATDQEFKQSLRENYDLDDFGMDAGCGTIGLGFENARKYFTFQLDASLMNPDAHAVAGRNYYIGVGDDVSFQGRGYDNMLIPEGRSFAMDVIGATMDIRGLITPFTVSPCRRLSITPWLDLGLFLFLGHYEIDAGPATGVTRYLNPPEDFVIGGRSEGFIGAGLPQIGFGGEIRRGPGRRRQSGSPGPLRVLRVQWWERLLHQYSAP